MNCDSVMLIGQRLRELRQKKKISKSKIEKRTGLKCRYTSRVESGDIRPGIEVLEKYAWVLGVPLYMFFYAGERPPKNLKLPAAKKTKPLWGTNGKEWYELVSLTKALARMDPHKRMLLLGLAQRLAQRHNSHQ